MVEKLLTANGEDFGFSLFARGKYSAELALDGAARFRMGRLTLEGKFNENGALEKKMRRHESADRLSVNLESAGVLPFGCEYLISREFDVSDGFAGHVVNVAALHQGKVGSVELEPLFFSGIPIRAEYQAFGEDGLQTAVLEEGKVLYESAIPLLMLRAFWEDGSVVEYSVGTDLWRHCAGSRIVGCTAEYSLAFEDGELVYRRNVLIYDAETVPEKRPWLFKSLLAWQAGSDRREPEKFEETFQCPGCQVSAAARRKVRHAVRGAKSSLSMTGIAPQVCSDAGHVERPGRSGFEHFDLAEYAAFRLWANRELAKNCGGALTMFPGGENHFSDSTAMRNFSVPPRQLEPAPEEEY